MTTGQVPGPDDLRPASPEPCPCGHGDLTTEITLQRPLVAAAIQGDPAALATLYDEHVDDVYRYLLAWTWDSALARDLTEQVFQGAVTWLPAIAEGEGDLGAWLIALARDAVGQVRGTGWGGQPRPEAQPRDAFEAIEQLDDAQREVVVLRLLLGHSVVHTAHLAGYDARVVMELQLSACAAIWRLLSGVPLDPPAPGQEELRPRWFEYCLAGAAMDPDADPGLSDVLAVADALRQGAPEQVPLPDDGFVSQLRSQLTHPLQDAEQEAAPLPAGRLGRAFAIARQQVAHHPWVATIVAAGAIGLVIGLQMAGGSPARSTCISQPCVATSGAASAGSVTSPSLPVEGGAVQESSSSVVSGGVTSTRPRPSTTRSSAASPTTAPPTTVPRTTATTLAPTTTRRRPPTTTSKKTTTTSTVATTTSTTTPGP
jgi:DNA-directed RNA polymerase specialized sigma24 family protein